MMTSCQVFGARAGRYAASIAAARGRTGVDTQLVASKLEKIKKVKEGRGSGKILEVKKELQKRAWEELLVVRSKKSLSQILQEIERIRSEVLPHASIEGTRDLVSALELQNLLRVAEIIANAGLKRTESRGSHYREDFPERNDENWQQTITVKKIDGKMRLDTVKVDDRWKKDEAELGWWG
jgi:succinate dehydrogenase/fumarate reductase flavoprotein subunit